MGIISIKKRGVKAMPSMIQKMRNTRNVSPKLISEEIFLENRKRYFGTFILVNIDAFERREDIPPLVASLKNAYMIFPQKR